MKKMILLLGLFVFAVCVMMTRAEPADGVSFELIGRGTYDGFKVKSENASFEFEAEAKPQVDVVVRTHDYEVGSTTGWHAHPGPVFITVTEGTLSFYEAEDPTCTAKIVTAGEGYLDTGHGHVVRNESGHPAKDVTVIIAPVGLGFRSELFEPNPACDF